MSSKIIVHVLIGLTLIFSACEKKSEENNPAVTPNVPDNSNNNTSTDPTAPSKPGSSALIGSDLCKQDLCVPYVLTFPEHSATGDMKENGEAFKIVKNSSSNVLSAEWKERVLYLIVKLPQKQNRIEFEVEIPKKPNQSDYELSIVKSNVMALLNESESSDVHVYAKESNSNNSVSKVLVTASLISTEDKATANAIKEMNPALAQKDSRLGVQNFRGAHQEVLIVKQILLSAFSSEEQIELKKWKKTKSFPGNFTLFFQRGKPGFLIEPRYLIPNNFNANSDYCYLRVLNLQPTITESAIEFTALITLVSGYMHAGPFSTKNGKFVPDANYSQGIALGIASAYEYIVPGKGFNKVGNGLFYNRYGRDERLDDVGCESKSPTPITVETLQEAFGYDGITIYYPRQNKLEALLDYKMGLNPAETKK